MRGRVNRRMNDVCTIKRREQVSQTATNEPDYELRTVAASEPCQYISQETSFVREDTGERAQKPARLRVQADVDVQEGDRVEIDGHSASYEVVGLEPMQDSRRGTTAAIECDLERID